MSLHPLLRAHNPEISAKLRKNLQHRSRPAGTDAVKRGVIAAAPNDTWQIAQPFELGQTIFGSDDERPYAASQAKTAMPPCSKVPMVPLHFP